MTTIKKARCYNCGSYNLGLYYYGKDMRFACYGADKNVWKCADCGLVQLLPQWTDEELDELYEGYTDKKDFKGAKQKKTVTKYLKKYVKETDDVLEIGAGSGDNTNYVKDMVYCIYGIDKEYNWDFFDYAKAFPSVKYDFIFGIQLLEHIADPLDFIWKVLNQLNTGGRFLFEIPNLEDPLLTIYKIEAFRKFYFYPYHLFFYTPEIIETILSKFNIKVKRYQRYGLINHLRWLIFKRPGNWNPNIPVLDWIYKAVLKYVFKKTDTMIIEGWK